MNPQPYIIYGLHRTCTNLVQKLMNNNLRCRQVTQNDLGEWKHAPAPKKGLGSSIDGVPSRFIVCIKHPLPWLVSMYMYNMKHKRNDHSVCKHFNRSWSFTRFLESRHYTWPTPIDRWNEVNQNFIRARRDIDALIHSEDLMGIKEQEDFVHRMHKQWSLPIKSDPVITYSKRISNTASVMGNVAMDFGNYKRAAWKVFYDDEVLTRMYIAIDQETMETLGYGIRTRVDECHQLRAD